MFSNQEIRTAMDGLVKAKGENHTSYGRYADPATGEGACFLGALCEYMGLAVPAEGTAAKRVLGVGAVSAEMAAAFSIAQHLNDHHFEWKYVLRGVDLVLEGFQAMGHCACGCQAPDFSRIIDQVSSERRLDKARQMKETVARMTATGGVITQVPQSLTIKKVDLTTLSNAMGSITFTTVGSSTSITDFTQAFAEASLMQKDHALTA